MITVNSTISIASQTVPPIIPAVQGDTGRSILFTLSDFTIPDGATATYYIQKPSGNAVYNSATISGNTIQCDLTAQALAEALDNFGQVRIFSGGEVVTSFDFILHVAEFRGLDAIESTTEMNIFDQAAEAAAEDFQTEAEAIAAEVIESIPEDYSTLSTQVATNTQDISDIKNDFSNMSSDVYFKPYGSTLIPTNPVEVQWIDPSKWDFKLQYTDGKVVASVTMLKAHTGARSVAYKPTSTGYTPLLTTGKKIKVKISNGFPSATVAILVYGCTSDGSSSTSWSLDMNGKTEYVFGQSELHGATNYDYLFIGGFYCASSASLSVDQSFYATFEIADVSDVDLGWDVNERIDTVYDSMPKAGYNFDAHVIKGINHRGYNPTAPENTLPAFRLSKQKGFSFVETDVRKTSDNVYVLLHDATINRTARNADGTEISSSINIADITYSEALDYDFGIWKSVSYAGTKIPTFEEFIKLCKQINLYPYIEIKADVLTATDISNLFAIIHEYGMGDNITWITSSYNIIRTITQTDGKSRVGMVSSDSSYDFSQLKGLITKSGNEIFVDLNTTALTTAVVTLCKNNGLPLEVYAPNTESDMLSLDDYISGATSDTLDFEQVIYDANIGADDTGIVTS